MAASPLRADGAPLLCAALLGAFASGCTLEPLAEAPCYEQPTETAAATDLCALLGDACVDAPAELPAHSPPITVVPDAAAMPEGLVAQQANNNLDIAWHRGRLFFALRTAPFHFASPEVMLYVVSTADLQTWTLETEIALEKDLREPRFLSVGGRLFLYFARLGEVTLTFKPEAMMVTEQISGCQWTAPEDIEPTGAPGFIPWRARTVDGEAHLIGYLGGSEIYEVEGDGLEVHWLKTTDGRSFEPAVGAGEPVLVGGTSETDLAILDDGTVIAVSRNEAGDELGWGSKICRGEPGAQGTWTCVGDPKKYDSPLVFRHGDEVYLIGRRHLAGDGAYDLGYRELSHAEQTVAYQTAYWSEPKRCALWRIDPASLAVEHVLDLPSAGDTCFASEVPLSATQHLVFNYSSPLDDLDVSWNDAQWGDTFIYRTTLTFP